MKFTYPSGSRPLDGYTIKRGIGRGGFGEVYYATSDGGKEVALKLIRRNLDVELRGVSHCLNLKHPNLLALYDVRSDPDGDTWVVMEFVGGDSLEDVVARHPQGIPAELALEWFRGIARGVEYLHDHGIVHRDLKPANVFSDEGGIKIGDYGLSKFISTSRRSGQTESVGTVHYMAPEVANGRYGREIDVYALGVMLYEMLTGHVPFEGESIGEVLMKHLTAQPDLSALAEPYRTVVARALEKDPEQRIGSASEMLHLLGESATGPAHRPAPPARLQETIAYAPKGSSGANATGAAASAAAVPPPLPVPMLTPWTLEHEPVYCAVRDAWQEVQRTWESSELNGPLRTALIVVGILVATTVGPIVVSLATLYPFYYLGRGLYLASGGKPAPWLVTGMAAAPAGAPPLPPNAAPVTPPPQQPAAGHAPGQPRPYDQLAEVVHEAQLATQDELRKHRLKWESRQQRREWKQKWKSQAAVLPHKPPRDKFTELLGSMLLAAGVSTALVLVAGLVNSSLPKENLFWLALVGTVGSWAVLAPAKFWEGRSGEPIVRRLVLLGCGLAVGFFAFGMDRALLLKSPAGHDQVFVSHDLFPQATDAYGQSTLPGYLTYYALLFPILRWWKQAEPTRRRRFGLWPTIACVIWAGVLSQCWPYDATMGMAVAGTMSIATQLAAPWVDRRELIAQQAA